MIILAIETSCDETAAAVLEDERILSSVVWSQVKIHAQWGGVVPMIARRAHEERLPGIVEQVLKRSGKKINDIDSIAVTIGPGLAPALEAGIAYAKKLALQHQKSLIPVSHLTGHIASLFLKNQHGQSYAKGIETIKFPALNLIVSGNHTELVVTERLKDQGFKFRLLGETLDDAVGECLDKVGRELGLGYPAGPVVEKLARDGILRHAIRFPIPMERSRKDDLNFSFSGLKTAAAQWLHQSAQISSARSRGQIREMNKQDIVDFCASFQEAAIDALLLKVRRAVDITGIKTLFLCGGVAANNRLRRRLGSQMKKLGGRFFAVDKKFTGDNAAMIGLAGQWASMRGEMMETKEEIERVDRQPNLNFSSRVQSTYEQRRP